MKKIEGDTFCEVEGKVSGIKIYHKLRNYGFSTPQFNTLMIPSSGRKANNVK